MPRKFDFSGFATRVDLKCGDGRTIRKDAFKDNDGQTVPLVWQHLHNDPSNVLGHALLENREDGVYAFCTFNESEAGKNSKLLVEHGDITALSIHANQLVQKGKDVLHGIIREVSLVLAGANPGALIDNLSIEHGDGSYENDATEAIIYTGELVSLVKDEVEHADPAAAGGKTMQEVFDTLNEDQKDVVYAMLAHALEEGIPDPSLSQSDDTEDEEEDTEDENEKLEHSEEGGKTMKKNVFDKTGDAAEKNTLTHAQLLEVMAEAQKCGSFKEALTHAAVTYGIENIDYLFPDARNVTTAPEFIARRMEWVNRVISGAKHSPFSRIKSMSADLTLDTARARGYNIKGTMKKEEFFALAKRTTIPTTIYKKQKLDRDDIIDITDLDVVAWLKGEMRVMLDEEIARAVLIGDGREIDDPDKINEEHIRPVAFDDAFYAPVVTVATNIAADGIIEAIVRARTQYKGSGTPTLYTTDSLIIDLLLIKDKMGRRLYSTETELAAALRVSAIVPVEVMEALPTLLGVIVNMTDYTMGADKGGNISMFDDFDIDYNQYKYLIETRMSGCLTKAGSALVIKRSAGTLVAPTVPTFVAATGVVTIPTKAGVEYLQDDVAVSAGAQAAVASGATTEVVAVPATGYYFAHNTDADWTFVADVR